MKVCAAESSTSRDINHINYASEIKKRKYLKIFIVVDFTSLIVFFFSYLRFTNNRSIRLKEILENLVVQMRKVARRADVNKEVWWVVDDCRQTRGVFVSATGAYVIYERPPHNMTV